MKKILTIAMIFALLLCGCKNNDGDIINTTPSPSPTEFEEVAKVDVEVKDYVEPTAVPAATKTPESEMNKNVIKETDTDKAWANEDSNEVKGNNTNTNTKKEITASTDNSATGQPDSKKADITGKIICIDPGHGLFTENRSEHLAPGLNAVKPAFKEGTRGTQYVEDSINLQVAFKLKEKLEALGATVVMTRENEYTTLSNIERADFASANNADIQIKLHADGTAEGGSGMTILYPGTRYVKDTQLVASSKSLAKAILRNAVKKTGANNRGAYANSQMAGMNWSKVPVVLFEMGFMTNVRDEMKLADSQYQDKIAQGICDGILEYYTQG